jgi:hypothetical protein
MTTKPPRQPRAVAKDRRQLALPGILAAPKRKPKRTRRK